MKPWMPILAAALLVSASAAESPEDLPAIRITDQQVPPSWAVKQRLLIETQNRAVEKFYAHYFDQRGWYKGHLTWGIGIGSDDIMQGLANWPLFYALGGSQEVLQKYYRAFHGNVAQLSSQKVEAAPPWGVMHNGFVAADDMFHIEEVCAAEEVFLTGTAAEIAPVVEVDGKKVGDGVPGPRTMELMTTFHELVRSTGTPIDE